VSSGIVESSSQGNEGQRQGSGGVASGISRGRLVQRLSASSANLPAFINDLIHTQATWVAGTEASAFLIERAAPGTPGPDGQPIADGTFSLRPIAHIRPDNSSAETRQAALQAFQNLVGQCVAEGKDGALEVGAGGDMVDPQFCLVTLLRSEGEVVAASAVVTRCRDVARAQERLSSMQLIAGFFDLYTLKRTSDQSRTIAQSHQHVLQLATAVATATGFQSAAMNLCNERATRTGASRVSIGWLKGDKIRVKALSHTEEFDKRQELIVQLERAMEECYDQEEVVQYEPDGTSTNNVTREHQALSRAQGGNTVLSIPLRRQAEIEGVLTLEFAPGQQLGPQAATGLSVAADLLAPQLYDRYQNDRWLITKTGISIRENAKLLIGPKHMLAKLIAVAVLGLVMFITFYKPIYHVAAPFSLAADERRYVCAPFEGYIYKVNVHPGDLIKQGDVLFELNTYQLKDQLAEATARRDQAEKERIMYVNDKESQNSGIKAPRQAEAAIAAAKRDAAAAEMHVIQGKIDRAIVKAEFDGQVLDMGELRYKIGAPVKLGDQLMVIGKPDDLYAELRVGERDIQDVRDSLQRGDLAVSSAPTEKIPFKLVRIIPQTEVKETETIYKVRVAVDKSSKDWKPEMQQRIEKWLPGMEGQSRVDVGNRRLAWIWTHRFVDWTRLHLWSNPLFAPFFK
jgi:multidrug efflux pump subunit AcrA (membrane-fusion protein)